VARTVGVPLVVCTVICAERACPVVFGKAVSVTVDASAGPGAPPLITWGVTQSGIPDTCHDAFADTMNEYEPPPAGNPLLKKAGSTINMLPEGCLNVIERVTCKPSLVVSTITVTERSTPDKLGFAVNDNNPSPLPDDSFAVTHSGKSEATLHDVFEMTDAEAEPPGAGKLELNRLGQRSREFCAGCEI